MYFYIEVDPGDGDGGGRNLEPRPKTDSVEEKKVGEVIAISGREMRPSPPHYTRT